MNYPAPTRCKSCGVTESTAVCRWCGFKKFGAALAVALSAGCATIDPHTPPPADWPRLEVVEHRVSFAEMLSKCYPALTTLQKLIGTIPLACAWIDLQKRRCDIYLTSWASKAVVEHERDHCDGRDHVGESTLGDLWKNYRAAGGQ